MCQTHAFTQLFDINAEGQVIGLYALADGGLHSFLSRSRHLSGGGRAVSGGGVHGGQRPQQSRRRSSGAGSNPAREGDVTTFLSHGFLATPAGLQAPTGIAVRRGAAALAAMQNKRAAPGYGKGKRHHHVYPVNDK